MIFMLIVAGLVAVFAPKLGQGCMGLAFGFFLLVLGGALLHG